MDVGAEYGKLQCGYDTERSLFNGKFSPRQRAVYDAFFVWGATFLKNRPLEKKEFFKLAMLTPGVLSKTIIKQVGVIMQSELVWLRLIDQTDIKNQAPDLPAYKKYFHAWHFPSFRGLRCT